MYCFHLDNKFSKVIAVIEYSEEKALNALYEKDIPFIKKLWERYYDDCIFSVAELTNAQRDLAQYMDLERWDNHQEKETKEQLQMIYKLMAIVSYALQKDCALIGSGD